MACVRQTVVKRSYRKTKTNSKSSNAKSSKRRNTASGKKRKA